MLQAKRSLKISTISDNMSYYIASVTELMHKARSDIPALIKDLRRRLDLTQEQFAQKVGVTYSTINHWENGKRVPQPFLMRRLLEIKEELDASEASSADKTR